jgi:hypothetical protein
MFLDLYVLQLSRKNDKGQLINGLWRKCRWIHGEALFSTQLEAKRTRSRVGGHIIPFHESRIFSTLQQEIQEAIRVVQELDMQEVMDKAASTIDETQIDLTKKVDILPEFRLTFDPVIEEPVTKIEVRYDNVTGPVEEVIAEVDGGIEDL